MWNTLRENPFGSMKEDALRRIVLFERSNKAATNADEIARAFEELGAALRQEHGEFGIVFDMRRVAGSHDPEIQAAVVLHAARLRSRFKRGVVLMKNMTGALHAQRLERQNKTAAVVTTDEAAAFAFAAGELQSP